MNAAFMLSLVVSSTLAWPQAPTPPLTVTPARLTFIARADRATALPQRVTLVGNLRRDLPWRAVPSAPWLHVSPESGKAPGALTIAVDVGSLAEGSYRGRVTISTSAAPGPPSVVEVWVEIAPPQSAAPPPAVGAPPATPSDPKLVSPEGTTPAPAPNVAPPAQGAKEPLKVAAQMPAATRNLPYSQAIPVTGGKPPFTLRLTQGRLPPGFRIEGAAVTGVSRQAGNYAFVVAVTDSATPPSTVVQTVSLRVILLYPDTAMTVYPASLALTASSGTRRASASLAVSSGRQALDWRASVDVPWLTLKPSEGRGQMSIQLEANPADLAPGTFTATVTVSMEGVPNSPARIPVRLTVRK